MIRRALGTDVDTQRPAASTADSAVDGAATRRIGRGTPLHVVGLGQQATVLTLLTPLVLLTRALSPDDLGSVLAALATGVLERLAGDGGLPDSLVMPGRRRSTRHSGVGTSGDRCDRFAATLPADRRLAGADRGWAGKKKLRGASRRRSYSQDCCWRSLKARATTIVASIFRARGHAGRFAFVTTVFTSDWPAV